MCNLTELRVIFFATNIFVGNAMALMVILFAVFKTLGFYS